MPIAGASHRRSRCCRRAETGTLNTGFLGNRSSRTILIRRYSERAHAVARQAGVKEGALLDAATLDVAVIGDAKAARAFVARHCPHRYRETCHPLRRQVTRSHEIVAVCGYDRIKFSALGDRYVSHSSPSDGFSAISCRACRAGESSCSNTRALVNDPAVPDQVDHREFNELRRTIVGARKDCEIPGSAPRSTRRWGERTIHSRQPGESTRGLSVSSTR